MKVIKHKDKWYLQSETGYKEILLSTDIELQKDGVQAIDDEFLEWLVKNPSCEYVEVLKYKSNNMHKMNLGYKITIPKEEPNIVFVTTEQATRIFGAKKLNKMLKNHKQETLEEVDENKKNLYYYKQVMNPYPVEEYSHTAYEKGFIEGYQESTKWQQERSYSEEDMIKAICMKKDGVSVDSIIEKFKKK